MKAEELTKKREEAERKARRGEIDPTHEFTFHLIGQVVMIMMTMIMMIVVMIGAGGDDDDDDDCYDDRSNS